MILLAALSTGLFQSCKDAKEDITPDPVADQTYTEDFDSRATAEGNGWIFVNKSESVVAGQEKGWSVRNDFSPYSGTGYLYSGYQVNEGTGLISTWAISPEVTMQNGDKITFYTRTYINYSDPTVIFSDRLQVRLNLYGGDYIDNDPTSVGGFTSSLIDINPRLHTEMPLGYPNTWTRFEATIAGLDKPVKGRYAFRYFVPESGTDLDYSYGLGVAVDKVTYTSVNH